MTKNAILSNFWTDFQSEHDWRFPEVPPWQIHRYLGYPVVDHSESLRAEWLGANLYSRNRLPYPRPNA